MKPIGALKGLDPEVEGAMPLAACRDGLDLSVSAVVLRYLSSGAPVFDAMEATPDPRSAGHFIPGGSSLLTDGTWCWRLDLAAYVEAYALRLPTAFVQQAVDSQGVCAAPTVASSLAEQAAAVWGWA